MVTSSARVCARETELIQKWRREGKSIRAIHELTGRSCTTIKMQSQVKKKGMKKKLGRPSVITPEVYGRLKAAMRELQKKAQAENVAVNKDSCPCARRQKWGDAVPPLRIVGAAWWVLCH